MGCWLVFRIMQLLSSGLVLHSPLRSNNYSFSYFLIYLFASTSPSNFCVVHHEWAEVVCIAKLSSRLTPFPFTPYSSSLQATFISAIRPLSREHESYIESYLFRTLHKWRMAGCPPEESTYYNTWWRRTLEQAGPLLVQPLESTSVHEIWVPRS